jgi:hypothetical protein
MGLGALGTGPGDGAALQEPPPASRLRPQVGFTFHGRTVVSGSGVNVRQRLLRSFGIDLEPFGHHRRSLRLHGRSPGLHGWRLDLRKRHRSRLVEWCIGGLQGWALDGLRLRLGRLDRVLVDEGSPTDHEPLDDLLPCGREWLFRSRRFGGDHIWRRNGDDRRIWRLLGRLGLGLRAGLERQLGDLHPGNVEQR